MSLGLMKKSAAAPGTSFCIYIFSQIEERVKGTQMTNYWNLPRECKSVRRLLYEDYNSVLALS